MIKKSSNDWYEELIHEGIIIEIIHPSGWDKNNLSKSFLEKISIQEFGKRLIQSDIYCLDLPKLYTFLSQFQHQP